ncbi:YopX family protein [Lysinibacillus piscis]|uniref:YopX protein domain-containing protein n=1 Tax=Lysinibacillus piscis TaxID=2518931 RepID=A0ABQ5NMM6_9BACI|nr:YopX family protein [Lysinibacillus sp. KH24]GLC89362.1 hypothetical protein LYSBPC_24890 [Lysinibacillus sp. KH24]
MREFKFRVWDKDVRKMHICGDNSHDSIVFDYKTNQACYYNLQNGEGSSLDGTGTYDLMQYTGLKDNHDKEIYEGDILEDSYGYRFPIFFNDGCYQTDSEDFETINEHLITYHNLKIVGNIHENPELLGGVDNES